MKITQAHGEFQIRFFCYAVTSNEEVDYYDDIVEITEEQFIKLNKRPFETSEVGVIYERHTIFENGSNQICLTIDNALEPECLEELEKVKT